jgi:hypothetical protein
MKTIRLGALGVGIALVLFLVSSPAEATTITAVVVTTGGVTYNSASVGWTFPVSLSVGQDLILSQDFHGVANTTTSYNFDTSDNPVGGSPTVPRIDITADGVTTSFFDTNQVLNVKNQGSVDNSLNEAQDYGLALVGPGYQVFLGYADNVHPDACGAYASSLGLLGSSTCLPAPFTGPNLEATGGVDPGIVEPLDGFHCIAGQPTCYDAGVIRIEATPVPEPTTMTLLLAGLAAFAARRHRQARKGRGRRTDPE